MVVRFLSSGAALPETRMVKAFFKDRLILLLLWEQTSQKQKYVLKIRFVARLSKRKMDDLFLVLCKGSQTPHRANLARNEERIKMTVKKKRVRDIPICVWMKQDEYEIMQERIYSQNGA